MSCPADVVVDFHLSSDRIDFPLAPAISPLNSDAHYFML